jgi:imidazolonepropionase
MPPDSLLLTGSGRLLRPEPYDGGLPWAILVRDGRIAWLGPRTEAPDADSVTELAEALVTPGLVNAHTHPAFLGDRSDEAAARLAGAAYNGGGILRSVESTRASSDDELRSAIAGRLRAELAGGTTTVECKSGYGLSTPEELRALRLIGEVAETLPLHVLRTFLGAHAVPAEASMDEYAALVIDEMLPAVSAAGSADFCDVFCDRGFFSLEATERILEAAAGRGLGMRMHADQLTRSGGAELAVRLGATSADHLEQLDAGGVAALAGSRTVATLLPGPAIVMRGGLPPARALLNAGATVALASDANAGTFGAWGAMPLVIGLGATTLEMSVQEAVAAATTGGAAALGLSGQRGALEVGADADIVAWDAEHEGAFALNLGEVRPAGTWIGGESIIADR